jgi:flagellar FliL protein
MKKLLIVIVGLVMFGAGCGTTYFLAGSAKLDGAEKPTQDKKAEQSVLVQLQPFLVNLSSPDTYLKTNIQFALADGSRLQEVEAKKPVIRDAIITLLSSKSLERVSAAEGKHQLKDEILYRGNMAMGDDVFNDVYFTEFVMQ